VKVIETADAPRGNAGGPFPYSQAVAAGGLIFVSGQGPFDPVSGAIVGTTIQEQTRQALSNVQAILETAGSSMDRIVNATFVLTRPEDFAGMNEEWKRWFTSNPPARSGARHPLQVENLLISMAVVAEA
jgi:2-iminobutanoate/2-iminopropanoate deaminase